MKTCRKKLWPNDTIVEFDHSVNAAIKKLRLAVGDSAGEPRYVETVARRGYRLMVAVEWEASPPAGVSKGSSFIDNPLPQPDCFLLLPEKAPRKLHRDQNALGSNVRSGSRFYFWPNASPELSLCFKSLAFFLYRQ